MAVLVGTVGGVGLAAVAGARRTQSAYPRFLRHVNASTLAIDPGGLDLAEASAALETVARRPEVAQARSYVSFDGGVMREGKPDPDIDFELVASVDGRYFDQDRFTPTHGRLPDPRRTDEVAVNETAAERIGFKVGQRVDIGLYTDDQISDEDFFRNPPPPKATDRVTIVGVGLFPEEVVQDDYDRSALVLFTPAYTRSHIELGTYLWQGLRLRNGDRDIGAIKSAYIDLLDPGTPQFFRTTSIDAFHALQSLRPLSIALAAFGLVTLLAALVLAGQALSRQMRFESGERLVWRALGARRGDSMVASLVPVVVTAAAGASLACLVAVAASPLMPIGPVRRVEVSRGLDADALVLGLGILVIVGVLVVAAGTVVWRDTPARRARRAQAARSSRVVGSASRAGAPPPVVAGLRLALEPGEGPTAVPVRSVMASLAVAVAALLAAIVFSASLTALVDRPARFGWDWDATLWANAGYGNIDRGPSEELLAADRSVDSWSHAWFGSALVDGHNLPLLGVEPQAPVVPPIVAGRSIRTRDEVVVGVATLSALHKRIGDTVRLGDAHSTTPLRVVGTAVFPTIGIVHGEHASLGVGALVAGDLVPGVDRNISGVDQPGGNALFVRFRSGVDRTKEIAALRRHEEVFGGGYQSVDMARVHRPAEIVNTSDTGAAPALLATALGLAAAVSLALALHSSVRRRRRDFALLKTLGFTRRQLSTAVGAQATACGAVALVIGVPAGVILGRLSWELFARQLDVVPHPEVPLLPLVAVGLGAVAVINLVAWLPARAARAVNPAAALRDE